MDTLEDDVPLILDEPTQHDDSTTLLAFVKNEAKDDPSASFLDRYEKG